jgi:4-hydroxy-3-polyprenylbenzoate decarboxylase
MNAGSDQPIAVAVTGASGAEYGLRLLEYLIGSGRRVYLMCSQAGQLVVRMETEIALPSRPKEMQAYLSEYYSAAPDQLRVFGRQEWTAPVASGSQPPEAMVVCPCTTGTLSSIAAGSSDDLICRAGDVIIKEQRKLILVVRETPFSVIHLENMLKLARMGVVIMPANPGFYYRPQTVQDLVDFIVSRILDHLGVENMLTPRWGEPNGVE